jgi:PPM family protein phosphatase
MGISISAFTHLGTSRDNNEDALLVNETVLQEGDLHITSHQPVICFVADGVGGNNAGEFASSFVLEKIKSGRERLIASDVGLFSEVNRDLLDKSNRDEKLKSCATTLSGIVADEHSIRLYHAGDSAIWLYRENMFFQVTEDQVLDPDVPNSPITSYFGGGSDNLRLESTFPNIEFLHGDIILLCSDGLMKAIHKSEVAEILALQISVAEKSASIFEACLKGGMPDNTTVILSQLTTNEP